MSGAGAFHPEHHLLQLLDLQFKEVILDLQLPVFFLEHVERFKRYSLSRSDHGTKIIKLVHAANKY